MDISKINSKTALCLFGDIDRESRVLGRSKADWMRKHLGDVKLFGGSTLAGAEQAEAFFAGAGECVGELYRWGYRGCDTVILLWSELLCLDRRYLHILAAQAAQSNGVLRFQCGAVGRLDALAGGERGQFRRMVSSALTPYCCEPEAVTATLRREILGRLYRSGVRVHSPETLDADDVSSVGEGTELFANVTLRASVVGRGCRLERCFVCESSLSHDCVATDSRIERSSAKPGARILGSQVYGCAAERGVRLNGGSFRDCVLGAGSTFMPESSLSLVSVGERCRLGMCNQLRDGVRLGADVWSACGVRLEGEQAVDGGRFLS